MISYCQRIECRKEYTGRGIRRDGIKFCSTECADIFGGNEQNGIVKDRKYSVTLTVLEHTVIHQIKRQIEWAELYNPVSLPELRMKLLSVIMELKKKEYDNEFETEVIQNDI